jgi:hypothetical protein
MAGAHGFLGESAFLEDARRWAVVDVYQREEPADGESRATSTMAASASVA